MKKADLPIVAPLVVLFGSLLIIGYLRKPFYPPRRNQCLNNLKQLGLSLLNYDARKGHLPLVYTVDASDHRLFSWRAELLPDLEQTDVYNSFILDEPWNSPHNIKVAQRKQPLLHCPSDEQASAYDTSYVAIVGSGFLWDPARTNSLKNIPDGAGDTIMLIELKNSGIQWAEPRDMDLDNLPPGITKENLLKSLSNHPGGFNVVFADGATRFIHDDIPWADFYAMLTIAGGEKVDRDQY